MNKDYSLTYLLGMQYSKHSTKYMYSHVL